MAAQCDFASRCELRVAFDLSRDVADDITRSRNFGAKEIIDGYDRNA